MFFPFSRPRPVYLSNLAKYYPRNRKEFRTNSWNPFRSLYNSAWNRVRDWHPDMDGGFGVGVNEARHWHSRAYGGLVSSLH